MIFLEVVSLLCLFFYEVKGHANVGFTLRLEVEEAVRPLKLIQIALDIIVVVNILLQLRPPLPTLLLVHEILAVHVVEVDAHLGAVRVALPAEVLLLLLLLLVVQVEVEPQLLHFDREVVHVLA